MPSSAPYCGEQLCSTLVATVDDGYRGTLGDHTLQCGIWEEPVLMQGSAIWGLSTAVENVPLGVVQPWLERSMDVEMSADELSV